MTPKSKTCIAILAAVVLTCLSVCLFACIGMSEGFTALAAGSIGLGTFLMNDAALKVTKALPNGAATIYTDGIDLGLGSLGDHLADCELLISAPALATGVMGDGKTMKYSVQHDTDAAFGTAAVLLVDVLTQTGAAGAGAAAATVSVRLPVDVNRYIRVRAIGSATGDCSGSSVTAQLRF